MAPIVLPRIFGDAAVAAPATFGDYAHRALVHPFTWGLVLGVAFAIFVWISNFMKNRELRAELRRLREHLHTQMDITSRGNSSMRGELDTLKSQNENLRVAVKEWQQKPGRAELRTLAVYDRAIRILNQNAPGFSPVWERAVKESEDEIVATESGMGAMLRRAFRPLAALGNGTSPKDDKAASASTFDDGSGSRAGTPE